MEQGAKERKASGFTAWPGTIFRRGPGTSCRRGERRRAHRRLQKAKAHPAESAEQAFCILTMATSESLSGSPLAAMGDPACAAPPGANARRHMRPEASPRAAGAQRSPGPAPSQRLYNCSAIGTKSVFRTPSSSVTSYPAGVPSSQVSSGSRSRSTARCRLTTSSFPVW